MLIIQGHFWISITYLTYPCIHLPSGNHQLNLQILNKLFYQKLKTFSIKYSAHYGIVKNQNLVNNSYYEISNEYKLYLFEQSLTTTKNM